MRYWGSKLDLLVIKMEPVTPCFAFGLEIQEEDLRGVCRQPASQRVKGYRGKRLLRAAPSQKDEALRQNHNKDSDPYHVFVSCGR
jgi:hypothetical protein